ncbi:cobyrinate a,c-diamide synthase [Thermodesulfatator atlanticus]|uniref:cobyrinate a,c-diamide synthase n=1 Tax=Thermodesulfatator atlanticus TaxID=501497 RepID=UPI0003B6F6C4|nr:cobyrinate a,c-diamide synthase [Thermodesulfatator atlanticus]
MTPEFEFPRLLISAQKGGAGKTLFSLGLLAALVAEGKKVVPFKKGPDYIDAGWLSYAAKYSCYNLDPFFMSHEVILSSFVTHALEGNLSVIEGNRGLLDGVDIEGTCSSAQLARILKAPVILVLDCTKVTRSLAAFVKGCQAIEPDIVIGGVILNQIVRPRHEKIITQSIEKYTGLEVLGILPRLKKFSFPMRHLGLLPWQEHGEGEIVVQRLAQAVKENVNLERICEIARKAPPLKGKPFAWAKRESLVKIGVFRDKAFQFYYPENLAFLESLGAEILYLDALRDKSLPADIHALYIGGGFPETQGEALEANRSLREDLREAANAGLPIYAECGGLMFLGRRIIWRGKVFEMVGALPVDFEVKDRPQGHGYVKATIIEKNPFYEPGTKIVGHEFHYSKPINCTPSEITLCMKLDKGHGFCDKLDGVVYRNIFGAYTHVHVLGQPAWALGLLKAALNWKEGISSNMRDVLQPRSLVLNGINQTIKLK